MALQHLSMHAHAVLLLDNQVLLDQLNAKSSSSSRATSRVPAVSSAARSTSSTSRKHTLGTSPGRACLQGVNELAAQALLGLLWPVGEADQLARRTSTRQLVRHLLSSLTLPKLVQALYFPGLVTILYRYEPHELISSQASTALGSAHTVMSCSSLSNVT